MHNDIFDLLILGGGTAGLFAGYLLKNKGFSNFYIVEGNREPGKKLTVAGGGYGNLTNKYISHENYVGQDIEFTKHALKKFPFKKALDLFDALEIPLEERDFGQIFSLIKASEIRDDLACGLPIFYNCDIISASYNNGVFTVETSRGALKAKKILLATGSSAYPQINGTDIGLKIGEDLGLESIPFEPALTPFTLPRNSVLYNLAGISVDVGIEINKKKLIRPMLFTHTGISGPAILLLSCYYSKEYKNPFKLNFLPSTNIIDLCHAPENGKLLVKNLLCRYLPDRLAFALIPQELQNKKVAELSKAQRIILENSINKHELSNIELAPLIKAEAAKNGILTKNLDAKTMQALHNKNLYVVGEVMDITGHLGGYNIHWALASTYCFYSEFIKNI